MERAFPSGAWYPYDLTDAAIVFGFSLAGLYITGTSPRARSLRMLFACYLALNLVAFLLKGPIGSNSSRLFVIAGAPLLWLAANVSRERSRLVVLPLLAAALALQVGPFVRDAYSSWGDPASEAAYWKPAERLLATHADPEHRVEVVATRGHWEAYYLAKHGIPLARGWYRQDDFPQNGPLYSDDLTRPHVPPLAALARRPLRPALGRRARLQLHRRGGAPALRPAGPRPGRAHRALDDVRAAGTRPPS